MTTIKWCGFNWDVRDNNNRLEGPGWPTGNRFSEKGVWIDEKGYLHLKIYKDDSGNWQCAELQTRELLWYGQYTMMVMGILVDGVMHPIQSLDNNAVFAMFLYPPGALGPDGTHEIDIELSRWGYSPEEYATFMNWSTYSTVLKSAVNNLAGQHWEGAAYPADGWNQNAPQIHQFYRSQASILFKALDGWSLNTLAQKYRPNLTPTDISQAPMPLHFNLWLNQAKPPLDGNDIEVVVKYFEFIPQK